MAGKPFRGVEVEGVKELNAALEAFIPKFQKEAIRHGSRKAAKFVRDDAVKRAPEGDADDPHYHSVGVESKPGQLKKAIKVRALPRSRTTTGAQVTVNDSLFVGDQFYGGFQELGWTHYGRANRSSPRGRGKQIEGVGFLRGALYDNQHRVFGIYVYETKAKISKIAKRLLQESGGDVVVRTGIR